MPAPIASTNLSSKNFTLIFIYSSATTSDLSISNFDIIIPHIKVFVYQKATHRQGTTAPKC